MAGWTEIAGTKIGGENTSCSGTCGVAINYPQSRFVVIAYSGAVFDTSRNRIVLWGGGHNDYSGNELYAIDFDTNTTLRLTDNTNPSGCGLYSCDGGVTPNSRHTYHNMAYIPTEDVLLIFAGGLSGPGVTPTNDLWAFSFTTNTWTYLNPLSTGTVPDANWQFYMEYYAPTDVVIFQDSFNLYQYKYSTKTWTTLKTTGGGIAYPYGFVDPVRHKFYVVDQAIANNNYWYDMTGADGYQRYSISFSGDPGINGGYPGMVYDPVSGDIVIWKGGDTVYRLNTGTDTITAVTGFTGGPGNDQDAGTYGRWNYSPVLAAFVLVNSIDQNAFKFELGAPPPPDTTPPSAPTGLTATAISSSRIDLSWTASTDNVAVTGYLVERCTGSACTSFAQIATPTATSYSNTGLGSSTLYRYQVRATDAAANLSSYSSIAEATTNSAGNVLTVGVGKMYSTIAAANAAAIDGNVIEIDAGIYPNESMGVSVNNLTFRGVGGYAHMKWDTGDWSTGTTMIPNGQGLLKIIASNTIIESMEFSGARVDDENGAGIRYAGGGDLTIRTSYFHNNENGILGQGNSTAVLRIDNCIFYANGRAGSGGTAHNVYIGQMGTLIFRYNKSYDASEGHCLKSRANVNEILYNYLSTKNSDGSYECEFPWGGTCYVIGNVIEQGQNTNNSSILGFAAEGATNPTQQLYIVNNTFMNWRSSGATFVQVAGTPTLLIRNNIFSGGGTALVGASTDLSSNNAMPSGSFVNANSGVGSSDFHLATGASAINTGVAPGTAGTYSLMPTAEYVDPASQTTRTIVSTIDVGAYESSVVEPTPPPRFKHYPRNQPKPRR